MLNDDDFPNWQKKRRSPFFSIIPRDIEDYFEEIDKYFEEIFKDIKTQVPKDLIREQELPDGSKKREMGPG